MSSTFAVREIDKYYQLLESEGYYYKECAINARSPENEADAFETAFIQEINANQNLTYRSQVRNLNGKAFFVVLRSGELMEESCLRCHNTPEEAPKGLVDRYGAERSFHRNEGEIVSAISIRIPLAAAYQRAETLSLKLFLVFLLVLLGVFFIQFLITHFLIHRPIKRMHTKAREITESDTHLGEQIDLPAGREFYDMAASFNEMSKRLKDHVDQLEEMIENRTQELTGANRRLQQEIAEKTQANKKLEDALGKVKKLSGLLPMCSSCKKIRDDRGYWNQVEEYIQEHSDVQLSHGICEECADKLYGKEEWYQKRNKK
jgi:methyl-accepting chemotaxis protein